MQGWCRTLNWSLKAMRHWQVLLGAIQEVPEDLLFAKFVLSIRLMLDGLCWGTASRGPLGLVLKASHQEAAC